MPRIPSPSASPPPATADTAAEPTTSVTATTSATATMNAVRLHAFGPPENLRHEAVPKPRPGPGEVRIKVVAAGVHLVDTALREGLRLGPTPTPPELPTIPGREVAGTVEAIGQDVALDWLDRRVVAHLGSGPGGYAEFAVTSTTRLHVVPDSVPEEHALAMVGTGRTTMGILQFTDFSPSDTVVVLAAAGGIGALLVQYAKSRGAYVIGAAGGPAKLAAVRDLGADLAVDYTRANWAAQISDRYGDRPATYVLEGVGGELARTALDLLRPGGSHLSYGYASTGFAEDGQVKPPAEVLAARGITSQSVLGAAMFARIGGVENSRVLEERAMELVADRTLTPLVHHFPLAEAARAHRALQSRDTIGKVVLTPSPR